MALARTCSECGGSLEGRGPKAITCSVKCRSARARRRAGINEDSKALAAEQEVAAIVRREAPDVVTRIMKQELAPVVREAIDEDVIKAIGAMVGLTSQAVQVLERDIQGDDPVLAQRAAALVIKYTVGHPALVKPEADDYGKLEVHFNLPRPDAALGGTAPVPPNIEDAASIDDTHESQDPDTRVCDSCHIEKPVGEFVGGSDRCEQCFQQTRDAILARLNG